MGHHHRKNVRQQLGLALNWGLLNWGLLLAS